MQQTWKRFQEEKDKERQDNPQPEEANPDDYEFYFDETGKIERRLKKPEP